MSLRNRAESQKKAHVRTDAVIAPAALCARDFASAPLELDLASVAGIVLDVFVVSAEVVSSTSGGGSGGGFGGVCRHEGHGERHGESGRRRGNGLFSRCGG